MFNVNRKKRNLFAFNEAAQQPLLAEIPADTVLLEEACNNGE